MNPESGLVRDSCAQALASQLRKQFGFRAAAQLQGTIFGQQHVAPFCELLSMTLLTSIKNDIGRSHLHANHANVRIFDIGLPSKSLFAIAGCRLLAASRVHAS